MTGAAGPERAPGTPQIDVERLARALADVGLYHVKIEGSPSMRELAEMITAEYNGLAAAGTDRPALDLAAALRQIADLPPYMSEYDARELLDEAKAIARRALDGPEPVAGAGSTGDER